MDTNSTTKQFSVVIPVFNEQDNINWINHELSQFFNDRHLKFEIIYVEDGSTDNSLLAVKKLHQENPKQIHYISFSRNFGKEAATTAGIKAAQGDAVIVLDADGQHPIKLLDKFIEMWQQGYDAVIGVRRSNKNEGFVKKYGSVFFYKILKFVGGNEVIAGTTDFRLIDKKIVDDFKELTERNRVTRNLLDWLGYKKIEIPFDADERHAGRAAYSTRKLFKLAMDGIVSHSTRPLKLIALLGMIISFLSAGIGIILLVEKYAFSDVLGLSITGSALLAIFVTFLVGMVLVCQGLLALYIERIYYETQNRPLYIIEESK